MTQSIERLTTADKTNTYTRGNDVTKPDRVTRLIRIIGIQAEIAGYRSHENPEAKRLDALHLLLAEASKELTNSDHTRIFSAGCQALLYSSKIMHEWDARDAELEELDRQRMLA